MYDFEYELEIHSRKQLPSLMRTHDFRNTNIPLDYTRNTPKRSHATTKRHIYADDVYAMSEDSSDDRQHKKAKTSVPTNLTPVTIMVVDTTSQDAKL